MDTAKYEQLINFITNEETEQARALFHDLVVEKSRQIYESMMDEDPELGGQVGDLHREIEAEEEGEGLYDDDMTDEDDMSDEDDMMDDEFADEDEVELDMEEEDDGELEDRVVDLEDKLDELMAQFQDQLGADEEEDFADDEEDFADDEEEDEEDEEESMMEAAEMKQVKGLYGSNIGGDNGAQPKSAIGAAANKGQAGMASRPVNFAGKAETVPAGPKTASNYGTKGEGEVKGAGSFKNSPGQSNKTMTPATKPTTTQAGGVNQKSPVAESRRRK